MEKNSTSSDSEARKSEHWFDELHLLASSMQALYAELAAKLLSSRLHPKAEKSDSRSGKLKLKELIAEHLAETAEPAKNPVGRSGVSAGGDPDSGTHAQTGGTSNLQEPLANALSEYFSEHHSTSSIKSFMGRKMRTNTLEHINKALALGRQGDERGARVHADLAERCMQAAAENMSDEEFQAFRAEVEGRLKKTRLVAAE